MRASLPNLCLILTIAIAAPAFAITDTEEPITFPEVQVIGQREIVVEARPWLPGDIVGLTPIGGSNTISVRSGDAFNILLPSPEDEAASKEKAKQQCIADCNNTAAKENAICELTGTQIKTLGAAAAGFVWKAQKTPTARRVLKKYGFEWALDTLDPAAILIGGSVSGTEYVTFCKGLAAGRLATCLNTGKCKG